MTTQSEGLSKRHKDMNNEGNHLNDDSKLSEKTLNESIHEIIDYKVIDTVEDKEVGIIVNVIDHPGNTLIEVEQNGIEIILPINDRTFQKIDKETKQLFLDIPEGLIDIYLENEQ